MRLTCALLLTLLAAGCGSMPADDPVTSPADAAVRQREAERGQQQLEARLAEMQTSMTELLERLDVMSDRLAKLENGTTAATPVTVAAPMPQPAVAPAPAVARNEAPPMPAPVPAPTRPAVAQPSPARASSAMQSAQLADEYRAALMLYGRNKMADARRSFQAIFDADPSGDLADNALYWIGETYYAAGNYSDAMRFYRKVTTDFAEQNKAPDALYKIGMAYEKTGDLGLAKSTFEEVVRRYPYSTPAGSAKAELKRIKF